MLVTGGKRPEYNPSFLEYLPDGDSPEAYSTSAWPFRKYESITRILMIVMAEVCLSELQQHMDIAYPARDSVVMAGYRGTIAEHLPGDHKELYHILHLLKLLHYALGD
jgi:hypothetical protein